MTSEEYATLRQTVQSFCVACDALSIAVRMHSNNIAEPNLHSMLSRYDRALCDCSLSLKHATAAAPESIG
jgi:hypothetical protein